MASKLVVHDQLSLVLYNLCMIHIFICTMELKVMEQIVSPPNSHYLGMDMYVCSDDEDVDVQRQPLKSGACNRRGRGPITARAAAHSTRIVTMPARQSKCTINPATLMTHQPSTFHFTHYFDLFLSANNVEEVNAGAPGITFHQCPRPRYAEYVPFTPSVFYLGGV